MRGPDEIIMSREYIIKTNQLIWINVQVDRAAKAKRNYKNVPALFIERKYISSAAGAKIIKIDYIQYYW